MPRRLLPAAFAERRLSRLLQEDRILDGPFRGMRFSWKHWDPHFALPLAKFLGTYELELQSLVSQLVKMSFGTVVDIGAAEGYYAIGFALRCSATKVIAYEELSGGRDMIVQLAEANGVTPLVDIRGRCEIEDLNGVLEGVDRCLVMVDVEGYEAVLLDPSVVPGLRQAHVLVETHDCYAPGVTRSLQERFHATHEIEVIESRSRQVTDARIISPWLRFYAKYNVGGWMGERLYPVTWLFLRPRR
jgi:hypothetical protein